jgi:aminoglycoside 3-N-acetyltransferase
MVSDFRNELHKLGINNGDVVLMHSSMKALKTEKTPTEFIEDIISVIGPEGTLLVPALTYDNVNPKQPYFKARETEPCIGLIPRTFFRMSGVVRSLHPTHSVCALGRKAVELCSQHYLDETPVGPNSPFIKLTEYNGKILFIGNTVKSCTFMHGVEEIAKAPYTLQKERTQYIIEDENGTVIEKKMFAHDFAGWRQEYQRIIDILTFPDIKTGKVGQADCYLFEASRLLEKALSKFLEDPYWFVSQL